MWDVGLQNLKDPKNLSFNWLMQEGDGTGQSKGDDKEANYLPVWFLSNVLVETPSQLSNQINSTTNHHCILWLMASKTEQNSESDSKTHHFPVSRSRPFCPTPDCTVLRTLQPNCPCHSPQRGRAPSLNQQLAQKATCCSSTPSRGGKLLELIYYTLEQWLE